MSAEYEIRLKDHTGALVAVFDKFQRLQYRRQRNEPGWIRLSIDLPDTRTALFGLDYQVEVWRKGDWTGAAWQLDMEGFHRRHEYLMLPTGQERFMSWSVGYLELLARRIGLYWFYNVDAFTYNGYLLITATPPEVIGEFVNREAGPGAIYAGVDRRTTGLTLAAIAPAGAATTEHLRNSELMLRCQQLAEGYGLDMRIVGTGAALFEFQVAPLLGTDRHVGNVPGNPPVIFARGFGNMEQPHYIEDRLQEINHIFVGGVGEGPGRTIYDQQSAGLIANSPWNLREAWADGREFDTHDKLVAKATTELQKGAPIYDLAFRVIETPAYKYRRDWTLLDLVTARYRGVERHYRIEGIDVAMDDAGVQTIDADLIELD